MNKIELLSPVGGMEALHAAVQNGADAVYLGEKSFSARQNAENFGQQELKEAVGYAHERGVKVYLAMNTLVKDSELSFFEKGIIKGVEAGVDALIIQDFGGAHMARSICPELPIHASTQMSAHNEKDVVSLLERGFSRVVLARELKMKEIEKIYANTRASLEVFVHGALCVCVSGQCLMSSFIGGRSGNRGACAQPCRQLYDCMGKKAYYLSPKDLCLLDELGNLKAMGVDSLKIEGRMKSSEYVATVTGIYRKYLDNPQKIAKSDMDELRGIFVRGDDFTKAYFADINTPKMMNYHSSNDGISYRSDKELIKKAQFTYREGAENKKISVSGFLSVKDGEETCLTLSDGENTAVAFGVVPEKAISVPLDCKTAQERVGKLGQTPYKLDEFYMEADDNLTISAKDLNALRRECTEKLSALRRGIKEREVTSFEYSYPEKKKTDLKITASVLNEEQLSAVKGLDSVYMPLDLYEKSDKADNYVVALPKVTYNFQEYIQRLKAAGAKRVLASTVGWIKALQKEGIECIGDYGLNVFNAVSANEYKKEGVKQIALSPELNVEELKEICRKSDIECEILVYGRMLMMTTRACIVKGIKGKCECENPLYIRDKKGAKFLIVTDKTEHINMVYNTAVTFMADKLKLLEDIGADCIRLVFTDEDKKTTEEIISMYKGEIDARLPASFTRGYFTNSKNK